MEKEVWKEIDKNYSISSYGRVLGPNKILNPFIVTNNFGKSYYKVGIGRKHKSLANLLARTFLPISEEEKAIVRHIDGNTLNYSLDNLRWVNKKELLNNFSILPL